MIPQGSTSLNAEMFAQLRARIDACDVCADLQAIVNEAFASLSALKAAIDEELERLAPILALLTVPAVNPGAIVSWISDYITSVLTPQIKPYLVQIEQLQKIVTEIAAVTASIQAAAARMTNCSISIPAL
jgi:hypothetical protein